MIETYYVSHVKDKGIFMKRTAFNPRTIFITAMTLFFIIASTITAGLGVNIYCTTTSDDSEDHLNDASRYLSDAVRRCENKENIRLATLKGTIPAIVITAQRDNSDTTDTEHWIYTYDGYFMEKEKKKETALSPSSGEKLFPMKSTDFQILNDDLLEVNLISEKGSSYSFLINIAETGGIGNE